MSDLVIAASIAAGASIVSAAVGLIGIRVTRSNRREIMGEVSTSNGHTAGESLSRLEDMAWRHEQRLDGVEVLSRETKEVVEDHVAETRDLIADFVALQPGLHALVDPPDGSLTIV